jgi:hypothetical protein
LVLGLSRCIAPAEQPVFARRCTAKKFVSLPGHDNRPNVIAYLKKLKS